MAIVNNTFLSYSAIGKREDLSDVIYNISPEDTPFVSLAGKGKCKNTLFEWQIDSLAAAAANAQLEGDEATFSAVVPTTRVANYAQISRKTLILSDTEEVIDKAGRKSELAYQLAKLGAELKRDMEVVLIATNQAAVGGDSTTARKTAGLMNWIRTNDALGTGGVSPAAPNPTPGTARTDGTQRTLTEALLKSTVQACWAAGADIGSSVFMLNGANKQIASGFTGIATQYNAVGGKAATIVAAADIYVSDFGTFKIVPNRHMRSNDSFLIDPSLVEVAYLRPFKTVDLAKTGDAEKRMLIVEYGLKVKNEAGLGMVADIGG